MHLIRVHVPVERHIFKDEIFADFIRGLNNQAQNLAAITFEIQGQPANR